MNGDRDENVDGDRDENVDGDRDENVDGDEEEQRGIETADNDPVGWSGLEDRPVSALLDSIATNRIAPAGGTGIATAAAIGAALCEMGAIHTIDKPGFDQVKAEMAALRTRLRGQRTRLLALANADAEVVENLFAGKRDDVDNTLGKRAVGVPLAIAESCVVVMEGADTLLDQGTPTARADVLSGALLAEAALRGTLAMGRTNLDLLESDRVRAKLAGRLEALEERGETLSEGFPNTRFG